jgi:hypothetical protein
MGIQGKLQVDCWHLKSNIRKSMGESQIFFIRLFIRVFCDLSAVLFDGIHDHGGFVNGNLGGTAIVTFEPNLDL